MFHLINYPFYYKKNVLKNCSHLMDHLVIFYLLQIYPFSKKVFQMNMPCSACIENPKKFLASSTRHLILQKNLPNVYHDKFLGKFLFVSIIYY